MSKGRLNVSIYQSDQIMISGCNWTYLAGYLYERNCCVHTANDSQCIEPTLKHAFAFIIEWYVSLKYALVLAYTQMESCLMYSVFDHVTSIPKKLHNCLSFEGLQDYHPWF